MRPQLLIASSNRHKVQEIAQILDEAKVQMDVRPMHALGNPPNIEESAEDFKGNAQLKSEGIARWVAQQDSSLWGHAWVLADDSGLCVEALGGAPGVRSARFSGPDANDTKNNAKLVQELQARGLTSSPAYFCCALALTKLDAHGALHTTHFEGRAVGTARVQPAGEGGFGYDPHVWIKGQAGSFAQMSRDEKAKISHRGYALQSLVQALPEILAYSSPSLREGQQ